MLNLLRNLFLFNQDRPKKQSFMQQSPVEVEKDRRDDKYAIVEMTRRSFRSPITAKIISAIK